METLSLTITPLPEKVGRSISSKFAGPSAPSIMTAGASAESGLSFTSLLTDVVNPLQHIPVVGQIYRAISGDTIEPAAQVAGGALFGGPVGGLISMASALFGELFSSSGATADAPVQVASRNPARPDIYRV